MQVAVSKLPTAVSGRPIRDGTTRLNMARMAGMATIATTNGFIRANSAKDGSLPRLVPRRER